MLEELEYRQVLFPVRHPVASCRVCGCTQTYACRGGCRWELPTICSACCGAVREIVEPSTVHADKLLSVISRQDNLNILALAMHNAPGDWRRAAIAARMAEIRTKFNNECSITSAGLRKA